MTKITFIEHDGKVQVVDATLGESLMETAVDHCVKGIYADCFGDGGCATCQVYVDPAWISRLDEPSWKEESTLRFAYNRQENSRLSCYIKVTPDLDGLILRLPKRQF